MAAGDAAEAWETISAACDRDELELDLTVASSGSLQSLSCTPPISMRSFPPRASTRCA